MSSDSGVLISISSFLCSVTLFSFSFVVLMKLSNKPSKHTDGNVLAWLKTLAKSLFGKDDDDDDDETRNGRVRSGGPRPGGGGLSKGKESVAPATSDGLVSRTVPVAVADFDDKIGNPGDEWLQMKSGNLMVWPRARLAGGIWALRMNDVPWVGELMGNGGSFQSACFFNVTSRSEEYNPTLGGNMSDTHGLTASEWVEVASDKDFNPSKVFTKTRAAFYHDPKTTIDSAGESMVVKHSNKESTVLISQYIEMLKDQMIRVTVTFTIPPTVDDRTDGLRKLTQGTFEVLAAYMEGGLFDTAYTFYDNKLSDIGSNVESTLTPCIISSNDKKQAVGISVIKYGPRAKIAHEPFFSFKKIDSTINPRFNVDGTRNWNPQTLSKFNLASGTITHDIEGHYTFVYECVFGSLDHVKNILEFRNRRLETD